MIRFNRPRARRPSPPGHRPAAGRVVVARIEVAVRQPDLLPPRVLGTAPAQGVEREGLFEIEPTEEAEHLVEALDAKEIRAELSRAVEAARVPETPLPHLPHAGRGPEEGHQELGVLTHERDDIPEARLQWGLAAVEDGNELGEEPRPAEAAAADDRAVASRRTQHPERVPAFPHVTVAEDGDADGRLQLGDRRPVGLAGVQLGRGAGVDRDRRGALLLGDSTRVEHDDKGIVDPPPYDYGGRPRACTAPARDSVACPQ